MWVSVCQNILGRLSGKETGGSSSEVRRLPASSHHFGGRGDTGARTDLLTRGLALRRILLCNTAHALRTAKSIETWATVG